MIKIHDLSMVIAVQNAASKITRQNSHRDFGEDNDDMFLEEEEEQTAGSKRSKASTAASPKPPTIDKVINKCLIVKLKDVVAEMSPLSTIGKFANCEMIVNYFPKKPFLVMDGFSYEKVTTMGRRPVITSPKLTKAKETEEDYIISSSQKVNINEMTFHFHQLMELGEVMDELLVQEAAYRVASTPPVVKKDSDAQVTPMTGDFMDPPTGNQGSAVSSDNSDSGSEDGLDYLTVISTRSPSVLSDSLRDSSTVTSPRLVSTSQQLHAVGSQVPSIAPPVVSLEVNIKRFKMKFDGPFENSFEEDLLILSMDKMVISLTQDKSEDAIQDEIALLDFYAVDTSGANQPNSPGSVCDQINPDNFVIYTGITGGVFKMTIDTMFINLSMQQQPFIEAYKLSYTGLLYNASVKDDRIPVQYKLVDIIDTVLLHPFASDLSESAVDLDHPTIPAIVSPCDSMYVVLEKSIAPAKFYMDLQWQGETMDVNLHSFTMDCVDVATKIFEVSTPANTDPSPLLTTWDNMRYLMHGGFSFKFQKITVIKHSQDYMHQNVKMKMSMVNPEFHLDRKSFEFASNNLELMAEMTMKILPTRGRSTRKPKICHYSTKVCEIPAMVFALSHFYRLSLKDPRRSRFYNHHDVYLHPAILPQYELNDNDDDDIPHVRISEPDTQQVDDLTKFYVPGVGFVDELKYINDDRFYYFRSSKLSINYNIELRFADRKNEPITINLRLDNFIRILDSLHGNQANNQGHRSNSQSPADIGAENAKLLVIKPYGVQRPPTTLALQAVVNEVKVQMIINRIIFCSWPSAKNYYGIATLQEFTDFQIRVIRKNIEKVFPTNVINNTTILSQEELAGKYWDYYPTNRRLILLQPSPAKTTVEANKAMNINEIDEASFPLQVDHLFMEIYFGEIYVREWSTKHLAFSSFFNSTRRGMSKHGSFGGVGVHLDYDSPGNADSPDRRASTGIDGDDDVSYEPKSVDDVLDLFKPIHRLAHASKVIVSLTESGEVSSKSTLFALSGIMQKRDESGDTLTPVKSCDPRTLRNKITPGSRSGGRMNASSDFMIGKEWRRKSCGDKYESIVKGNLAAVSGLRRTTLERHYLGCTVPDDASATGGRPSSGRMNARSMKASRKSMLITPTAAGGRDRNRTTSAEGLGQVVESLVRKRRDSIIKPDVFAAPLIRQKSASIMLGLGQKSQYGSRRLKWGSVILEYKAHLRNFVDNHSAFTPPAIALPESYQGHHIRPSSNNRLFQKTAYTDKFGYINGIQDEDQTSSFGNKIWGLKVVDCRILFTIKIRDVLFGYVVRCMELFSADAEPEENEGEEKKDETENAAATAIQQRRPSTINLGAAKEKATLMDFLSVDEQTAQPSPKRSPIRRPALNSIHEHSPNDRSASKDDDSELHEVTSVTKHFQVHKSESGDNSAGNHPPDELHYGNIYPHREEGGWTDEVTRQTIRNRVFKTGGRGLKRSSESKTKQKLPSMNDVFSYSADDAAEEHPGHIPRTLSLDTDIVNANAANIAPFSQTNTPFSQIGRQNSFFSAPKSPAPRKKIPINQHFFVVELVDPQINFLDADKHGSLIIVAGRSSLEGKRLNTAILPPASQTTAAAAAANAGNANEAGGDKAKTASVDPKRRQEIRLKMDGVSAFTIPTLINFNENTEMFLGSNDETGEFEDEVFWKQLKSTSDVHTRPTFPGLRPTGNQSSVEADYLRSTVEKDEEKENEQKDSPFLKTAICDFQIRALYVFWTDVTAAEAKDLYVQQSKDALTYTFRLELPELVVDIFSWQFYVILNVIRNVLLVAPPTSSSNQLRSKGKPDGANEEQEAKEVVELTRDLDVLSKYDIKAASGLLDLAKQKSCEEIRALLEEYISNLVENNNVTRFVEVFIGRVYWKLRTNTTRVADLSEAGNLNANKASSKKNRKSVNEQELVEAALTGIYTTMNFYEDR